jgi:catechol 2,3-dioxygenase
MPKLGHLAYYVRNLERSITFYQKIVGLTLVARIFKGRAAVLSGGECHHELLLIQITAGDGPLTGRRIGLYHAGWKIGESLDDLRKALDRAQAHGTPVDGATDHGVMFSLYLRDPDDNEVELFVDNPDYEWWRDTGWMDAPVRPLDLSLLQPQAANPETKSGREARAVPPAQDDSHGDRAEQGSSSQDVAIELPVREVAPSTPPGYHQGTPRTTQDIPHHASKGRSREEQEDDDYDELQDPDALGYWLQNAQDQPRQDSGAQARDAQDDDDDYDEARDPDAIGYWLHGAQGQPNQPSGIRAQQQNEEDDYDESEDPDAIGYWLQTTQGKPSQASGVRPQEDQEDDDYDEAQDPDAIGYWLQTIQDKPGRIPKQQHQEQDDDDYYDESQDPETIEYWRRRMTAERRAKYDRGY